MNEFSEEWVGESRADDEALVAEVERESDDDIWTGVEVEMDDISGCTGGEAVDEASSPYALDDLADRADAVSYGRYTTSLVRCCFNCPSNSQLRKRANEYCKYLGFWTSAYWKYGKCLTYSWHSRRRFVTFDCY